MNAERRIGPYTLLGELGAGGMARVYEARHDDGALVAIKLLDRGASIDLVRRMRAEAALRVDHPRVVRTLDGGVGPDGTAFVVMERLEGETLDHALARGRVTSDRARQIGIAVAEGLAHLHQRGVVHRDIKPGNVFLCEGGAIKILDLGIALRADATRLTAAHGFVGTAGYAAPEQLRGAVIDARVDVFALGVLLYEAITGRCPFERGSPLATTFSVLWDEPEDLSPLAGPGLAHVIARCLRKHPDARFATAEALCEALAGAPLDVEGPPGASRREERIVTAVFARTTLDASELATMSAAAGGFVVPREDGSAVTLLGADRWVGDELDRGARLSLALATRDPGGAFVLVSGHVRFDGGELAGHLAARGEAGLATGFSGALVDAATAPTLSRDFRAERVAQAFCRLHDAGGRVDPHPLLGRATELARLLESIDALSAEGTARLVLVTGPAGIGKSRLVTELARQGRELGPRFVFARADPLREMDFGLIAAAIKDAIGGVEPGAEGRAVDRLRAILGPTREVHRGPLEDLLGLRPKAQDGPLTPSATEALVLHDRSRFACRQLFAALLELGPLVFVSEDLHWADAESLRLLLDLVVSFADAPFLVLGTARSELLEREPDLAHSAANLVELRGLGVAAVGHLVRLVAGEPPRPELVRAITERTGGNPLFVEHITATLASDDRLDAELDEIPMPATVEAALRARIERLPPDERVVCAWAAVLARPFSLRELELLGVAQPLHVCRALAQRDLLVVSPMAPVDRRGHRLRHALLAEAAYASMADDDRIAMHRAIAAMLAASALADVEEIARHRDLGGEREAAAELYASTALDASRRADGATLLRASGRCLELGAPPELVFALQMARADAFGHLGQPDEQAIALRAAADSARSPSERARCAVRRGVRASRGGRFIEAIAAYDEATADATDPGVRAQALAFRAQARVYSGDLDAARADVAEAVRVATVAARPEVLALIASTRGEIAGAVGDLRERERAYVEAARLYREAGDLRRASTAEANLADVLNRTLDFAAALAALEASLAGSEAVGNRIIIGYASCNLGYALARLGRTADALAALDRAEGIAIAARDARLRLAVRLYRARALLPSGRSLDVAREAAAIAEDARTMGLSTMEALALGVLAQARLAAGEAARAHEAAEDALALRDRLGGLEEDELEVFAVAAATATAVGDATKAEQHLARAGERIVELAAGLAEPARRAAFELRALTLVRAIVQRASVDQV